MWQYVKRIYTKICPLCEVSFECKKADRIYCDPCRQVRLNTLKRARRAMNPEKYRHKDKIYYQRTHAQSVQVANRRASKRGKSLLNLDIIKAIFQLDNYTCQYCYKRGGNLTIDHVQPLCKNGANDESNLVTACRTCNVSKNRKSLLEFLLFQRGKSWSVV